MGKRQHRWDYSKTPHQCVKCGVKRQRSTYWFRYQQWFGGWTADCPPCAPETARRDAWERRYNMHAETTPEVAV